MKRFLVGALALALGAISATAQSLEDLNIQIHGYATQGFLYTTQNNIFTAKSSDGSPAWTEAVVNLTSQPNPKLRVGVQARYFMLGNFGNAITLDWASADYKANDKFGVRFGKVKTPSTLFNETQDIDPSYIWSLLPQGIYQIGSRNSNLSHYGGVVYGVVKLGSNLGKLEYRGWGGERVIGSDDGYWVNQKEAGLNMQNGISGVTYGATLHWKTPLSGLTVGGSNLKDNQWVAPLTSAIPTYGTFPGTETLNAFNSPSVHARYEKNKVMVVGEYARLPVTGAIKVPGVYTKPIRLDQRSWYVMASYKLTGKLTAGVYDTQIIDRQMALGPARYSKDWVISGRYDFNQFLYAKAEEHIIDGTMIGYDTAMNPGTLKPSTKLTILKIGVSF
jgi:hypothetical protein